MNASLLSSAYAWVYKSFGDHTLHLPHRPPRHSSALPTEWAFLCAAYNRSSTIFCQQRPLPRKASAATRLRPEGCHGCMTKIGIITHNYYTSSSHYSSIETACRFLGFFRSFYLTHFFVTLQSGMFSQHCHRGLTFFATFPALPSLQAVHLDSHIHRCLLLGSSPSPLIAQKLCG